MLLPFSYIIWAFLFRLFLKYDLNLIFVILSDVVKEVFKSFMMDFMHQSNKTTRLVILISSECIKSLFSLCIVEQEISLIVNQKHLIRT